MKQAAFNREFRIVENFSVKHLINHSSDIKHSLCSVHAVCETMYWLAAVALEETPYFSIAEEGTVFRESADEFPLLSCLPRGNLHTHFLSCSMAIKATFCCMISQRHCYINTARGVWLGASIWKAMLRRSTANAGYDVQLSTWRISSGWQPHSTSDVTYRTTPGRPINAASLSSLSSHTSVVPPLWDLPKFGPISTDSVYWAGSHCTCSYRNHMFK